MSDKYQTLVQKLNFHNVRPSVQRVRILEYLQTHLTHPTADQVYCDLLQELPGLSKATVYNTLRLFVQSQLVREVSIEDAEMRYDIVTEDHGHFKCEQCGRIFNFKVRTEQIASGELEDFVISDRNVYFKGLCPYCLGRKH